MIPEVFLKRMELFLGAEEYEKFRRAMAQKPEKGVRVNTALIPVEEFQKMTDLPLMQGEFANESFRLINSDLAVGKTPEHIAGLIYVQEPSASSAVTVLDPQPGEYILDLCAAPGGKTTQIAAKLNGNGLVWANEYVKSRIPALLSNIERMDLPNTVVSNAHPSKLQAELFGCFDRVLVDAPCSGEGMFRKDPTAVEEWSIAHTQACAVRQEEILSCAADMVRPGGILVYSTCTFSVEENEKVIWNFLNCHADFSLENAHDINPSFPRHALCFEGIPEKIFEKTVRIFPQDGGEGHFVARLKRSGDGVRRKILSHNPTRMEQGDQKILSEFLKTSFPFIIPDKSRFVRIKDYVEFLPEGLDGHPRCSLRAGTVVGKILKNRIIPEHHFFRAFGTKCALCLNLSEDDPRYGAFLNGQEIPVTEDFKGWCTVCWNRYPIGFGKASAGRLKNHYPKGLRINF